MRRQTNKLSLLHLQGHTGSRHILRAMATLHHSSTTQTRKTDLQSPQSLPTDRATRYHREIVLRTGRRGPLLPLRETPITPASPIWRPARPNHDGLHPPSNLQHQKRLETERIGGSTIPRCTGRLPKYGKRSTATQHAITTSTNKVRGHHGTHAHE